MDRMATEDPIRAEKIRDLYEAVDALRQIREAHPPPRASHPLEVRGKGRRGTPTVRERTQLYGETRRQHLGLPRVHPSSVGAVEIP